MVQLKKALKRTYDVLLDDGDEIELEHNYCEHTIVDVLITDVNTGEKHTFFAYDTVLGVFPY